MKVHDIWAEAYWLHRKSDQRFGQALFNCLFDLQPELAKEIAGTDLDPFYAEDNSAVFGKLYAFLQEKLDG